MKLLPFAVLAAVAAFYASGASAEPAQGASFCGTARGVATYLVNSGNMISPTGGESLATIERKLKVAYGAIIKAQPALLSSAPGSIKPALQTALKAIDFVDAKLQAINWDFTKVGSIAPALEAKFQTAGPSIKRVEAYFRNTCHIKGA